MKLIWILFAPFFFFACEDQHPDIRSKISGLDTISIISGLDGEFQPIIIRRAEGNEPRPLVVGLHTWSAGYLDIQDGLLEQVEEKNFNFVHPHFRGPNRHVKACCSAYVIDDINSSIQWALDSLNVDADRIHILGASGGGYATLCMFFKAEFKVNSLASYVPISDLASWYQHCDSSGLVYASEIYNCTGSLSLWNEETAKRRSPINWISDSLRNTPKLILYAGIKDGHDGPVPIDHSIDFYNKLIAALGATDSSNYVTKQERSLLMDRQLPEYKKAEPIGDHAILFQKSYEGIRLVIFDGGHEMIMLGLLDRL